MSDDELPSEEAQLLSQLRSGQETALGDLFNHYREALRRMVALRLDHRLAGRVSPSDVLQESYLDACQRLHHYLAAPDKPFLGWLRLIVGQRMVDLHRFHFGAQQRDVSREVHGAAPAWPAASSVSLARHLIAEWTSPSGAVAQLETMAALEEALNQLEPIDREILTLRHFEELSNNQTAEILGIEKSAASKRYMRALIRLKDVLVDQPGFGGSAAE